MIIWGMEEIPFPTTWDVSNPVNSGVPCVEAKKNAFLGYPPLLTDKVYHSAGG